MTSEAAAILARALETEADLHERGEFIALGERYDDTLAEILPIQQGREPLVSMAFDFWDRWVDARNHQWRYHSPIEKDDWPDLAREMATLLRAGMMPPPDSQLAPLIPRPRVGLLSCLRRLLFPK